MLPALLLMLPVVVVDVAGDRLDPAHTRELVAKELSVDAVAPDDPRAAEATGRIEVSGNGAAKKLTVKYRKLDEPVERTIDFSDDRARAETDAALLAGNLARDEGSELSPPPAARKPAPKFEAETSEADDARRLSELRAILGHLAVEERSAATRGGIVMLGVGAALAGTGGYMFATREDDPKTDGYVWAMTSTGVALAIVGGVVLLVRPDSYAPLTKKLKQEEAKAGSAGEVVEAVDKEWAKEVEEEKSGRNGMSILNFVIGGLSLGTAAVLYATESTDVSTPLTLIAGGALNIAAGIAVRVTEGKLEESYRLWRTVKTTTTPERAPMVSVGIAPIAGGAAASFALTF